MSGVQNQNPRTNVHLDIQPENQRQTGQMDPSRCRTIVTSLKYSTVYILFVTILYNYLLILAKYVTFENVFYSHRIYIVLVLNV